VAEASAAAAKAQKLMLEHNLTMATLAASGSSSDAEGGKRAKDAVKGKAMYEYQQQLMATIARVNFCYVEIQTKWSWNGRGHKIQKVGYNLIGREANVIAATNMFDYLNASCERLAFDFIGGDNTQRMSKAAVSFKQGVADRLRQRVMDRHDEALRAQRTAATAANATAASTGTGLAIILEDYAQKEEDFNTDLRLEREPGTTERLRLAASLKQSVYTAAQDAIKALIAEGVLSTEALTEAATAAAELAAASLNLEPEDAARTVAYAVRTYVERALRDLEEKARLAKETPKAKAAREAKEEAANQRWWDRYNRQRDAKLAQRDHGAYRMGAVAGGTVGLDAQIDKSAAKAKVAGQLA
jgi:hypothetical protein